MQALQIYGLLSVGNLVFWMAWKATNAEWMLSDAMDGCAILSFTATIFFILFISLLQMLYGELREYIVLD